jgi:hypothetical protein
MDKIESLMSDNQVWFLAEINKMILHDKYKIIHLNTFMDECGRVVWTAVLEKNKV